MGQLDDMFEMTNQQASEKLRKLLKSCYEVIPKAEKENIRFLELILAIDKAIEVLENTPDEAKAKKKSKYQYLKLCPHCDGKDFHPVKEFDGEFYPPYKCPKCGNVWYECDDE